MLVLVSVFWCYDTEYEFYGCAADAACGCVVFVSDSAASSVISSASDE